MNENKENKNQIMVPIELIDHDICMSCPEIRIENLQMVYYCGDKKSYGNRLRCVHFERCKHLTECCSR